MLLADSEGGLFPSHFWVMILALAVVFVFAMCLKLIGWRVIDWITPGNLGDQLLGYRNDGKPNIALAIVVGSMFLGLSFILGCTIVGVMIH